MTSDTACSPHACRNLRVLVVEDDPEVLEATLEALELLGHWATGVRSAESALARFLEGAFDVVIADVGLPALSGLELAGKLQARCKVPIIFATARQATAGAPAGTFWLSKPFGIEQLAEALREVTAPCTDTTPGTPRPAASTPAETDGTAAQPG